MQRINVDELLKDKNLVRLAEQFMFKTDDYTDYYDDFMATFKPNTVMTLAIQTLCESYHRAIEAGKEVGESPYTFDEVMTVGTYLKEQLLAEKNGVA